MSKQNDESQVSWDVHRAPASTVALDENNTRATYTHVTELDDEVEEWINNFYRAGMGDSPRMDGKKE